MKPKEFDELIRQKFDQNDFEYDSRNWDRLSEQLDGRTKKRSVIMWWFMPLAGVAASVALAMGVTSVLRYQAGTGKSGAGIANTRPYHTQQKQSNTESVAKAQDIHDIIISQSNTYTTVVKNTPKRTGKQVEENDENVFAIRYQNAVTGGMVTNTKDINLLNAPEIQPKKKQQLVAVNEGYHTFKNEEKIVRPVPKLSVLISGGISHGSGGSGYMAAATIRKMVNDKVFIESAVGFASSSSTQATEVLIPNGPAARHSAAKSTATDNSLKTTTVAPLLPEKTGIEDQSYNLYYAQVSPSLGLQVIKKVSVGIGPDFQQMLADNRPAASAVDKNNQAVAPLFDVGLIGKTEYSVSRTVKAGVSYRKGINNVLTPMDKYIDRDYLQFQVKCAIFNK